MSDDLNSDARRLVDLAREARTPGEADKLRIAERLALPLAAGAAVGGAVSAAKAAAGANATGGALFAGWSAKVAAVVALGAAAGALMVSQRSSEPAARPASSLSAPVKPRPHQVEPPAAVATPLAAPSQEPAPSDAAPSEPPTHSKPSAQSPGPAHELAEEAALLHRAQAAWRAGQSAQALELANQHAQRFPRSQLGNERDVLRVLSLCKLGQARAAKQIGARLLQKAKGSPWYQSVAESCAGE
ncbi:MAG TPA: hypothetical protein VIW29_09345 [Polyangiaceae bacterium]